MTPKKPKYMCYFGCGSDSPLHRFPPNKHPHTEKFSKWKAILDEETIKRGDDYICNNIRICNNHFEDYYKSHHTKVLTRNAVPTLNLMTVESTSKPLLANKENLPINASRDYDSDKLKEKKQNLTIKSTSKPLLDITNKENLPTSSRDCDSDKLKEKKQNLTIKSTSKPLLDITNKENLPTSSRDCESDKLKEKKQNLLIEPAEKEFLNQPNTTELNEDRSRLKRTHSIAFATTTTSTDVRPKENQRSGRTKEFKRVTSCKTRNQQQTDVSARTVQKLKQKIQKLTNKYKTTKKQIIAAKRISSSKSLLNIIEKFPKSINLFTKMQLKYKKKPRGRRFTTEEKIMGLTIFKQGPKVYRLLKTMFVLPSVRSLQNLLNSLTFTPGLNKNVIDDLKIAVEKMPQEKRLINLLFDEVALAPGLQYNPTADRIIGFEDTGVERKKNIADHALVFMIKGIKGKTKQPILFTFCRNATNKTELKNLIKQVIRELRSCGFKVITTICDQAPTNQAVIKELLKETRAEYLKNGKEYHSQAFEIDGIKVYPLFDTPHLLKGVRNNLLTKNATFVQNGKQKCAKWEHLQMLLNVDEGEDEVRLVNKLTENHVKKDKLPKMKVKFAAQVFSQRVSAAMRFLAKHNILPEECADTADFLLIFDKLFDSFNGHSYRDDSKIYKSCFKNNSPHFKLWIDLLPILESIKFQSIERKNGVDVIKNETIPSVKNLN